MHEGSCKKLMGELILSINFKELPANKTCAFYKKSPPLAIACKGRNGWKHKMYENASSRRCQKKISNYQKSQLKVTSFQPAAVYQSSVLK